MIASQGDGNPSRVAVVGVGAMGTNHARVFSEMPNVALVGVSDSNAESCEKAGSRFRVPAYSDYHRLLEQERPEIVSVAVPTSSHFKVANEIIERGIHVLVEKPLAFSVEEGCELVALTREKGVRLGVGHIERFNPVVTALKVRLGQGAIGRIFQVTVRRLGPLPERIGDVGVLLDMATHDIDLLFYLIGGEVANFSVETSRHRHHANEDIAAALFRFKNGVIGVLLENWLSPTKIRELSINGEGGMFVADLLTQDLCLYENDAMRGNPPEAASRGISIGNMIRYHLIREEPLRLQLQAFVDAVVHARPFLVEGEEGLKTLEMAIRLQEAARAE